MPKDEQLTLTEKEQEKLEAIRVEMGFSSIEEAAQFLIKQALGKHMARLPGRNSLYLAVKSLKGAKRK